MTLRLKDKRAVIFSDRTTGPVIEDRGLYLVMRRDVFDGACAAAGKKLKETIAKLVHGEFRAEEKED